MDQIRMDGIRGDVPAEEVVVSCCNPDDDDDADGQREAELLPGIWFPCPSTC